MGLNDAEWIWLNLKYLLIISALTLVKKRYAPAYARIIYNISAHYRGRGDFCGDSEGCR